MITQSFEILDKYKERFKNIRGYNQRELEILIFDLGKECYEDDYEMQLALNWIKLIRKVQIGIELTEEEEKCLSRASRGSIILPSVVCESKKKRDKLLKMVNKKS